MMASLVVPQCGSGRMAKIVVDPPVPRLMGYKAHNWVVVCTTGSEGVFMVHAYRVSLGAMALLVAAPLSLRSFAPGITGIVRDVQSAAMPWATIEAVNLETNEVSRTVTNESGYYAIPSLGIGFYRITVSSPGFKKAERARMELRSGDQVQLDFMLEVGTVQETIEVTSEAELLQTLATDKGQVVGLRSRRGYPLRRT